MNKKEIKTNRIKFPKWRKLWTIMVAICLIFFPLTVFAQSNFSFDETISELFKHFAIILSALQAVLWPILVLIGGLIGNDLIFSGGMNTTLLSIWTHIRDFVNIIFVLIMVFVAIYNISGLADENYSISKVLPKIAIGLIAVNFSFLMAKVVLDAVNITTTAIFAIPLVDQKLMEKYQSEEQRMDFLTEQFCGKIMHFDEYLGQFDSGFKPASDGFCELVSQKDDKKQSVIPHAAAQNEGNQSNTSQNEGNQSSENQKQEVKNTPRYKLSERGKNFFSSFNSRNVALIMAIDLMEITDIDKIPTVKGDDKNIREIKSVKELAINTIFSLIFFIIYATAFVALFITLLVRVAVLWVSIALMPLSFLGFAIGKAKIENENDPLDLFLKHAFVPIKVALALTIGTIMISQLKSVVPNPIYNTDPKSLNAIIANMSTLQSIMAGMATAVVIWMATMWSMEKTKATEYVKKVTGYVENFGKQVAQLPLYAPILPVRDADGNIKQVGLAYLANNQNTPISEFMKKEKDRYETITKGNKEKYREEAKNAKTQGEFDKAIARIAGTSSRWDQRDREMLADVFSKSPKWAEKYKNAFGEKYKGKKMEDFIQDIQNSEAISQSSLDQAIKKAGIKPDFDNKNLLDEAKELERKYDKRAYEGSELAKEVSKLTAAIQALEKAKTHSENEKARKEVIEKKAEIEKMGKNIDNMELDIRSDDVKNNRVDDNDKLSKIQGQYKNLEKLVGENKAKEILEQKLSIALGNDNNINVKEIVAQVAQNSTTPTQQNNPVTQSPPSNGTETGNTNPAGNSNGTAEETESNGSTSGNNTTQQ